MAYETLGFTAALSASAARIGDRETAIQSPPAYTTLAAAIATAVADGATPTQAHVTAINTAWGTFKAAYDIVTAALGWTTDDVIVSFKSSLTINQRRDALRAVLANLEGIV